MAAWRQVEALRERGHEAELVTPYHPSLDGRAGVRGCPVLGAWGNAALLRSASSLWEGVDVLHLHYPFYGAAEQLLWLKRAGVPVVISVHMDAAADDWREGVFRAHRALVQPWLLKRADRLIVASNDYTTTSSLRGFMDRYPERVEEIPFFIDEARFSPGPVGTRKRGLLFVGALDRAHEFKGVAELLAAVQRLPQETLTIIGDGDRRAAIEAEVVARGMGSRVTFLGRVSEERLIEAYQQAAMLVFPSTSKAEAFGLVALEAQACGTPVIASRLPGVREVVLDGETGVLVEPGSVDELVAGIQRLSSDEALRKTLGAAARSRVEQRYSKERVVSHLEQLYRTLCASRS